MSGIAIMMMVLFIVIIWGGLAASIVALRRHPDEASGVLGEAEYATDDVLIAQEEE
ncbi:methionine/alanine import NSS transporter subunit MetS [Corynebacterium aquilae]|uniref:Amino acid transporter n=1 Tax=Corynebacterium aquilae DSM 44791 TaxID=1431546 RepID=A0A1L7CF58_9CORY|nr:methionine/alanine import NSS transporter subunit MetS [Corynebacterium aquilae]APT84457.1 amino acid transporter [Corynebacterium aquilae DSM 44791]